MVIYIHRRNSSDKRFFQERPEIGRFSTIKVTGRFLIIKIKISNLDSVRVKKMFFFKTFPETAKPVGYIFDAIIDE